MKHRCTCKPLKTNDDLAFEFPAEAVQPAALVKETPHGLAVVYTWVELTEAERTLAERAMGGGRVALPQ